MSISDFFLCSFQELVLLVEVYRNKEKKQWEHTRMICYCNMVANWQNPKRRPPSLERYMRLDVDRETSDDYAEERMKRLEELQRLYVLKVQTKNMIN